VQTQARAFFGGRLRRVSLQDFDASRAGLGIVALLRLLQLRG
jgi:hypothetical protein